MAMRAQLSLIFTDEDLFKNFIEPSKANRELHGIILRCLSAYYYNEQVRNLIEGCSISDVAPEGVKISSSQENIDSIREMLAMQSYLSTELQNTMEDGIDDFTDILSETNKHAEEQGFMKAYNSEYTSKEYKIARIEAKKVSNTPISTISGEAQQESGVSSDIAGKVNLLFEFFSTNKDFAAFINSRVSSAEVGQREVKETPSLTPEEQVLSEQESIDEDFSKLEADMTDADEQGVNDRVGEAASSMAGLLESIGI